MRTRRSRHPVASLALAAIAALVMPSAVRGGEFDLAPNLAPAIASNDDSAPTALIELDGTGSENPDGGALRYEWTQIDGPRVELSDPAAAKPSFRTGQPGLYRFQLVVDSGGMRSDPFIVEIMIERDNQPPVAKVMPEIWGEVDKEMEIDGAASLDPEGAPLIYRWRLLTPGLDIPPGIMNLPKLSFVPKQDGVYEIELMVSDGETVSKPALVRLNIKPKPRPPVARAKAIPREIPAAPQPELGMTAPTGPKPIARIEGPVSAKPGEKITLDARASRSSDGNRLEYLWRQKSGPFVSDFEMAFDGAAQRFTPPRAGEYEFELMVSDGGRDSDPAIHRMRIMNDPVPPVAVVTAPIAAPAGTLVKMDAARSYDAEGAPLTYRWRQTGGPRITNYIIDRQFGDAAPAFQPPSPGKYSFELVVSNGALQSKPVEIDIDVTETATPALSLSIAGPAVSTTGERLLLSAAVENAASKQLEYVWRQTDGPSRLLDQSSGASIAVFPQTPGRYIFDLTALDAGRVAATARRSIEVFSQPAPIAAAPVSIPAAMSAAISVGAPALTASPAAFAAPQPLPPAGQTPPALKSLLDMPNLPPLEPAGVKRAASAPVVRPVAQIHPTMGNSLAAKETRSLRPSTP